MLRFLKRETKRLAAQRLGFSPYMFEMALDELKRDARNPEISWRTKVWAWRHGFTAQHAYTYEIDQRNFEQFIPNLAYYRMHPVNGMYGRWIDDKLTMRYVLAPFADNLPKYYFQLESGYVLKLLDCPDDASADHAGIIALLERIGEFALKPLSGSRGSGFHHLTFEDGVFAIDGRIATREELLQFLQELRGYLATEYVRAHPALSSIYAFTPNTVRLQVLRPPGDVAHFSGAFIRFGSTRSGVRQESPSMGAIAAGVDLETGSLSNAWSIEHGKRVRANVHPDTAQTFDITLPHWQDVKTKIAEISNYIPQVQWAGFDIVITRDSFKVLEINSLSAPGLIQHYHPPFNSDAGAAYFGPKLGRLLQRQRTVSGAART